MIRRCTLIALAILVAPLAAKADCQVTEFLDLPVTITNMHPLVDAGINGVRARFVIDSGSWSNSMTPGAAKAFHLEQELGPYASGEGVGGAFLMYLTTVKVFTLAHFQFKNVPFLVGGSEVGDDSAGLLGQELLSVSDVDYDFSGGVIRFMRPKDCGGQPLAYWLKPGQTFGELGVGSSGPDSKEVIGAATVNGVKVKVLFDTGGGDSLLSLAAAKRAGIAPGDPGVIDGGSEGGLGSNRVRTWIAPVKSFEIGGEQILNTRLRIGNWTGAGRDYADMILGDDFFLSHHVYVANSQRKVYFTYNGGPVFNLEVKSATTTAAAAPASGAKTAVEWARLGASEFSREAWSEAIADYSRAIDLDARKADYYAQRGRAYLWVEKPDLGVKDLDQALNLDPADIPTRIVRARQRLDTKDQTGARADLAAADQALGKESDFRLDLAYAFAAAAEPREAVASLDDWIAIHPVDNKMPYAMAERCWARALANQDLGKALADCQAALRRGDSGAKSYRALVRYRLGDFTASIADESDVLADSPKCAWCLYGRGLARMKLGMTSEGKADIAAAVALNPALPDRAKTYGLTP
ncbi:MAG TPA: aspartyl protease family protein [Caulobacteraceae bacterium]